MSVENPCGDKSFVATAEIQRNLAVPQALTYLKQMMPSMDARQLNEVNAIETLRLVVSIVTFELIRPYAPADIVSDAADERDCCTIG